MKQKIITLLSNSDGLEKIRQAYISKQFKAWNKVILVIITDGGKWHGLAMKSLSRLLHEITSKHNDDYYCMNCPYLFSTESKL